jgi:hypothetical protein
MYSMRRARILLLWGVWVAILPFLGFPYFWKNIFFVISGLGMIYISFMIYKEEKEKEKGNRTFENFSENSDFADGDIGTPKE